LVSPEHFNDGEEPGALTSPKPFSQGPHYIHDEMSDASTNNKSGALTGSECFSQGLHYIHDEMTDTSANPSCVPEDDVSVIGEVTEMMKVAADSSMTIFSSPIEEILQAWRHCCTDLWSPLQDLMQTPIPSTQNLMLAAKPLPYMKTYSQCSTGLQEQIQ
jgi:hypothetical protein